MGSLLGWQSSHELRQLIGVVHLQRLVGRVGCYLKKDRVQVFPELDINRLCYFLFVICTIKLPIARSTASAKLQCHCSNVAAFPTS